MLDLWNNLIKGDDRDLVDEILQGDPLKLYLLSSDVFYDLDTTAQYAIDGCLDRDKGAESRFYSETELPMYAIIAYCDSHTNIDTRCIIELLHSIRAEITRIKVIGGGPTKYGPKRSKEELEYLKRQLWITDARIRNHLYVIATPEQRTGIYEAKQKERNVEEAIIRIGSDTALTWAECAELFKNEFTDYGKHGDGESFRRKYNELCRRKGIQPAKRDPGRKKTN